MKISEYAFVITLTLVMLIGLSVQPSESNIRVFDEPQEIRLVENTSVAAIAVGSNGGFISAGFSGSGTEGDPYILDGATVTDTSGGYGIQIQDTTAHFRIQNSIINLTSVSSSSGIYFDNISNGTIYNCTIIGSPQGIWARDSSDVNISKSVLRECSTEGIVTLRISRLDIYNNTVSDCGSNGMNIAICSNTTIVGNKVKRINYDSALSSGDGLEIKQCTDLVVVDNHILSTKKGYGIDIDRGGNVLVDGNIIWDGSIGMRVYNSPSIIISNNNISCALNYNLWMHTVSDAHVFGNRMHHTTNANGMAIRLENSSNGLYEYNDLFKCWYGISADSSSGNNTFYDNNIGWCDLYTGYDSRSASPKNNWTSNQFSDFSSNPYNISGSGNANDSSASLLTDSTSPTIDSPADIVINDIDTNMWVTWHPDDRFPNQYIRYINYSDPQVFDWCNSSISISLDDLAPGVYDISIRAYDCAVGSSSQDNVRVTVLDTQPPVFTSATDDYTVEYGERVWFNITATDDTPAIKKGYEDEGAPIWNDAWTSPLTLNWDKGFASVGVHNYTIELIDKAGNSAVATCIVTVEDTTAPASPDFPSDFGAETGDEAWVNFTINELSPDNYEIWLDDVLDVNLTYTNGQEIHYQLNYDVPGEHNVTLIAWDDYDHYFRDTCIVTYSDSTGPIIFGPEDSSLESGDSILINWSYDELNPMNWSVYENDTLVASGTSFMGDIQYLFDNDTLGNWNLTLVIFDTTENSDSDEVWITVVDTTAAVISGPVDFVSEAGDPQQLMWTWNELHPKNFTIFMNESIELANATLSTDIEYTFDDLTPGIWNITVIIFDESGNWEIDEVLITVEDTSAPTITGFSDLSIEYGSIHTVKWNVSDIDDWDHDGTWIVYVNGTEEASGIWNSMQVNYTIEPVIRYEYNLTVVVTDAHGNSDAFTTWVTTHDSYPPQLTTPADVEIVEGANGTLSWTCSEQDPARYTILRNGTVVLDETWDGSNVSYHVEGLSVGTYNFTIVLYDGSGNAGTDTVIVTIVPDTTSTSTTTSTSSTTTETSETTSNTDTSLLPPMDMILILVTGMIGIVVVVLIVLYMRKMR